MPLFLAALLAVPVQIFVQLMTLLTSYLTMRIIVMTLITAAFAGAMAVFANEIYNIAAGLAPTLPPYVTQAFDFFMPTNTIYCINICVSASVARLLYDYVMKLLTLQSSAA